MNCPTCTTALETDSRICSNCATEFSLADWTKLHQYDYLLSETATWESFNWRNRRRVISKRFAAFQAQWQPASEADPSQADTETAEKSFGSGSQTPEAEPAFSEQPEQTARPRQSQPFDQWLFSERTIKSALYSGAFLLILAGMIFVGANWTRLAWTSKLAVIALQTVLMTVLGLKLLRQSASLRVGGLALTAVAAGFAPLNSWLVQHYWLRPTWDFDPYLMLFLGGAACAGFYVWLMRQTRSALHSLSATLAVGAALTGLSLATFAQATVHLLSIALIALLLVIVAQLARGWDWIEKPPRFVAYLAAGLVATVAAGSLIVDVGFNLFIGWQDGAVLIAALVAVTALYALTEHWRSGELSGFVKYAVLFVTVALIPFQFDVLHPYPALLLMGAAGLFLAAYFRPIQTARLRTFFTSVALAILAVGVALAETINPDTSLAIVLVTAVVYLLACAYVRKQTVWLYLALWLLIAPVAIYGEYFTIAALPYALWFAALMVGYVAASYVWRRVEGAFVLPAVALSVLTVAVAWSDVWWGAALLLVGIGAGYLLLARRWPVMLVGGLVSAEFFIWRILSADLFAVARFDDPYAAHVLSYAAFGIGLILLAAAARNRTQLWCQLAYAGGALNLAAAYAAAQTVQPAAIRIGLAFLIAAGFIAIAWRERKDLFTLGHGAGGLTAAALIFIYVGHIQLMLELKPYFPGDIDTAAIVTIVLCASFVLIGLTQRKKLHNLLFGQPLNWLGLGLMLLPLTSSINNRNIFATVAAIAGLTILFDGWKRTDAQSWRMYQIYLGIGVLLASGFALLDANGVSNLQAYALPLGIALVLIGWNERRRKVTMTYLILSLAGLVVLFGSAFVQSLEESVVYAYLLLIESVIAVRWGIITRSRGYVQLGILALVANGVAQFGPAFSELPRFAQVGSIGSILLLGGLVALFQREELLATQDTWRREWAKWNP